MTVADFIATLQLLPADAELGVLTATAFAQPPVLVKIDPHAWATNGRPHVRGFRNLRNAYLIRPQGEVI